jgi:hypothetical protein
MDDFIDFKQTCSSFALAEINNIKINISSLIKNGSLIGNSTTENDDQFKNSSSNILNQSDMMKLMYFCKKLTPHSQLKHNLIKYIYPILIIFGILGNFMALYILLKKSKLMLKFSRNFSFTVANLCVAHLFMIVLGCLREYIDEMFGISISSLSIYSCRIFYFSCYMFSAFSSYLYTFIAYSQWQRIMINLKSENRKNLLLKQKNNVFIFIIFIYCVFISLPFLYFPLINETIKHADIDDPLNIIIDEKCEISKNGDILLVLLDSVVFYFIPFLLSIMFSFLSVTHLVTINKLKVTRKSHESQSTKRTNIDSCKNGTQEIVEMKIMQLDENFKEYNMKIDSVEDANMETKFFNETNSLEISNPIANSKCNIFLLLVIFPIAYVVTNCPIFSIILIKFIDFYFKLDKSIDYEIGFVISKIFMYLLVSCNMLVYVLIDNFLRKQLLSLFNTRNMIKNKKRTSI